MHMADALLSPIVGIFMMLVSAAMIVYSLYKLKQEGLDDKKIPMMAVMGAFVFAAQMINFTIPGTGSSGHICGGILLAALLGPYAGLLVLAVVLIIQCLFFGDGGLLALGCNIFNLGVACLIIYPLVFKPIVKRGLTPANISGGGGHSPLFWKPFFREFPNFRSLNLFFLCSRFIWQSVLWKELLRPVFCFSFTKRAPN